MTARRMVPLRVGFVACVSLAAITGVAACGSDGGGGGGEAVTAHDIITATRAAGTATASVQIHQAAPSHPEKYGLLGSREQDETVRVEFDFANDRAQSTVTFDAEQVLPDVRGSLGFEVRAIGDTTYVRDGSWLCPGCALDGERLPSDKWILVSFDEGDVAFGYSPGYHLARQLGWVSLVEGAVAPSRSEVVHGTRVDVYEVDLDAKAVERVSRRYSPDSKFDIQGRTVALTMMTDRQRRLRGFVVKFRMDDRDVTYRAVVKQFGRPVNVETPPADEIYRGP